MLSCVRGLQNFPYRSWSRFLPQLMVGIRGRCVVDGVIRSATGTSKSAPAPQVPRRSLAPSLQHVILCGESRVHVELVLANSLFVCVCVFDCL